MAPFLALLPLLDYVGGLHGAMEDLTPAVYAPAVHAPARELGSAARDCWLAYMRGFRSLLGSDITCSWGPSPGSRSFSPVHDYRITTMASSARSTSLTAPWTTPVRSACPTTCTSSSHPPSIYRICRNQLTSLYVGRGRSVPIGRRPGAASSGHATLSNVDLGVTLLPTYAAKSSIGGLPQIRRRWVHIPRCMEGDWLSL
ncbi:hypothetical protein MVEN_00073000 [Mycena venus]|uniref:Secreted protein n=1 Tax=Mycena venus TaxID=2733690 RepID=A0A8H6Z9C6_9AGAR|nr:hypothetical protein MVEN_00073000 [Mycena venus]